MDEQLVKKANELLSTVFSLKDDYRGLEELREPILKMRCELGKSLAQKREQYRIPPHDPKIKDEPRLTDFDRNTRLNAAVAELNSEYEYIKGIEDLIKERMELIRCGQI